MIMCLSPENTERCPSDVMVLSTHPTTAGWHSVVLFVEGYSPHKSVSKTEVASISLIAADGDVPQMWLSQRNSRTEHELRKGDLRDILVISKNTRQAEFDWKEKNSEEVGHA